MPTNNELMAQALTELSKSNERLASTLDKMDNNLKILNDTNILHQQKTEDQHKDFSSKLDLLMTRYWWLVIGLIVIVLLVLGYKEVVTKFLGIV
jgi:hypothetical protein